jgi:membrane dipeptidase
LHSHAGRCFLAGLPPAHSVAAALGPASVAAALEAARAAGMTALCLSAVADFMILRPDPAVGLRAVRDFRPGEAYADYQRQLAGIRAAVAEAGAEVATSPADLDRAARDGRTAVLLGCEGGDFLEGDLRRLAEARAAGITVLTLVHYRVSEIGDVQTEAPVHDGLSRFGRDVVAECNRLGIVIDCAHASFATTMAVLAASSQPVIISHGQLGYPRTSHPRLMTARHAAAVAEAAGPDHVAIGTDLDGNYRPVLTRYDQLDELTSLLQDRGLAPDRIHQVLGGNALRLLNGILPNHGL